MCVKYVCTSVLGSLFTCFSRCSVCVGSVSCDTICVNVYKGYECTLVFVLRTVYIYRSIMYS